MKNKLLSMTLSLLLVLVAFTACGGSEGQKEKTVEINDAQSLVSANRDAQKAVRSYHMDGNMDMDMSLDMGSLSSILNTPSVSMPMTMTIALDSGKETAHGTTSANMDVMGQSQTVNGEMYCDLKEGILYSRSEGEENWTKSEQDISSLDMNASLENFSDEVLADADFSASEESYTLKLSAKSLGESVQDLGLLSDMESSGVSLEDLNMTEGEITFTFDKEKVLLQKVKMSGVKMDASGSLQGVSAKVNMDLDADYTFGSYDQLDPADYEIPSGVR